MAKGYGFERDLYGGGDGAAEVIRNTVAAWLWAAEQAGKVRNFATEYLTDKAMRLGLEQMGVTVPDGEPVTAENIGWALGNMIAQETGLSVGNVLDAASVRAALRAEALRLTAEQLGIGEAKSVEGIADALAGDVRAFVDKAARGEDAEMLEAVKVSDWATELARRGAVRVNPASTRPDAANNRERQDRFRGTHRRVKA